MWCAEREATRLCEKEIFGKEPSKRVHPDEVVALGAAIVADSEARFDAAVEQTGKERVRIMKSTPTASSSSGADEGVRRLTLRLRILLALLACVTVLAGVSQWRDRAEKRKAAASQPVNAP